MDFTKIANDNGNIVNPYAGKWIEGTISAEFLNNILVNTQQRKK